MLKIFDSSLQKPVIFSSRAFFKKSYITLIEILIVLTILVMIGGTIGVNVHKAFREQRFLSDVQRLVDQLQLAQDLMLTFQNETVIVLTKKEKGIEIEFKTEKPFSKLWKALINKQKLSFKAIQQISFNGQVLSLGEKIKLDFLSYGFFMSKGELVLYGSENHQDSSSTLVRQIDLVGYPKTIVSHSRNQKGKIVESIENEGRALYPEGLEKDLKSKDNTTIHDISQTPKKLHNLNRIKVLKIRFYNPFFFCELIVKLFKESEWFKPKIQFRRRYFQLLEVLIAMMLVVLCTGPLIHPHIEMYREQVALTREIQLNNYANRLLALIIERLYNNDPSLTWQNIVDERVFKIDHSLLQLLEIDPSKMFYEGDYSLFIEKEKKKKKGGAGVNEENNYLLNILIKFTAKKSNQPPLEYHYKVFIQRQKMGLENPLESAQKKEGINEKKQ